MYLEQLFATIKAEGSHSLVVLAVKHVPELLGQFLIWFYFSASKCLIGYDFFMQLTPCKCFTCFPSDRCNCWELSNGID